MQKTKTEEKSILAGYRSGDSLDTEGYGDYVIGVDDPYEGYAESSELGAHPWYYTVYQGKLYQGKNVFELYRKSGQAWEWDFTTISQIALLGHPLGEHTLHPNIHRLPAAHRIEMTPSGLKKTPLASLSTWEWDKKDIEPDFQVLKKSFEACVESVDGPIQISMSGGSDSRLLLALCLHYGIKPEVSVMGTDEATDIKLARLVTQKAEIPMRQVLIHEDDYLDFGKQISYDTSGLKTMRHWHTWLFSRAIQMTSGINLVGSNGGFAKSYYRDVLSQGLNKLPLDPISKLRLYIAGRGAYRFRKHHLPHRMLSPLTPFQVAKSLPTSFYQGQTSWWPTIDSYFLVERVPHFTGLGISCYQEFTTFSCPFFDQRWLKEVAGLKRHWKLEERYHHQAIRYFSPILATVPCNKDPDGPIVTYAPFQRVLESRKVKEMLIESRPLDALMTKKERQKLLLGKALGVADLNLLFTLHFAALNTSP